MATWNNRNNSNISRQPNQLSTFDRYAQYRATDEEEERRKRLAQTQIIPRDSAIVDAASVGANAVQHANEAWAKHKAEMNKTKQPETKNNEAWAKHKAEVQKKQDAEALNYLEQKKLGNTENQKNAQKIVEGMDNDTLNLVKGWANGGYNKTNVNEEQLADMGLDYDKLDDLVKAYVSVNNAALDDTETLMYSDLKLGQLSDEEQEIFNNYRSKSFSNEVLSDIQAPKRVGNNLFNNSADNDYRKKTSTNEDYLYNALKELDPEKWTDEAIASYKDYSDRLADAESTDYRQKFFYGTANENGFWKGAANTLMSLDPKRVNTDWAQQLTYDDPDPNGLGKNMNAHKYRWSNDKEYMRNVTSQDIENNAGRFVSDLYQMGTSAAESMEIGVFGSYVGEGIGAITGSAKLAQVAADIVTLSPYAKESYNSAYKDARARGLTLEASETEALVSAITEAMTEKVSFDQLGKLMKAGDKIKAKKYWLEVLKEAHYEGREELINDVVGDIVDNIVAGGSGKSKDEIEIADLMEKNPGMSYEEASSIMFKNKIIGYTEDYFVGAGSGLMMGGVASLTETNRAARKYRKYSESIEQQSKTVAKESTDTEYGRSEKERAEKFAQNPTAYLAENIDDSTETGKQQKELLRKYADKVDNGRKLSRSDMRNIEEVLEEANVAPRDMSNFFVPEEYKSATTNMSVEEGRKAIQDAIKAKDQNALGKAYRDMSNSTSVAARNGAKEAMEQFTGMAQNAGLDVESAMVGTQEAYLKGLNGEKFQSSDANLMQAFTDGEKKRVSENKTRTINNVNDLKTNVETSSGVKMVLGTFNSDGEIITNKGTIKADDIIEDTAVRKAYQYASQKENIIASDAFMRNIKDGENIDTYNAAFNSMYRAGATNVSFEQATKEGFLATQANHIGLDRAKTFWELGRNEYVSEAKKTNDEAIGKILDVEEYGSGIVIDNRTDKSDTSNLDALNMLAKFAGKTNIALCDDNSAEFINGENAFFDATNSTIYVKNGNLKAVFHELAELTDFYNSKGFEALRQSAVEWMARDLGNDKYNFYLQGYKDLYSDEGHSYLDASKEMVNDYLVAVLKSGKGSQVLAERLAQKLGTKEARTFGQKLKNWISKVKAAIQKLFSGSKEMTDFMQEVNASVQNVEEVVNAFVDALEEAVEIQEAAFTGNLTMDKAIEDGAAVKDGDTIRMSKETYDKGGRDALVKFLAEESGLTQKDQNDIVDYLDAARTFIDEIISENDLQSFEKWSNTGLTISEDGITPMLNIYKEDGKPMVSVVVNNGEYPLNIDFSQVCKKRVALNNVLIELVKDMNFNLAVLTETDIASINDLIKKHGFEIACGLCFVDSKRYRVDGWASSFTDGVFDNETMTQTKEGWNDLVKSMLTQGVSAEYFDLTSEHTTPVGELLHNMTEDRLDFTHIDEIVNPFLKPNGKIGRVKIDGKNVNPNETVKMAYLLKNNRNMRRLLDHQDLINSASLDDLRVKYNPVYKLVNAHGGTAKPKLSHGFVAYGNEILRSKKWRKNKKTDFNIKNAYAVGGVRVQSFSDFVANMFFDYMQMFGDMAARQLPSHAYTKELAYAKLFGMTGQRINMSLIFKGANLNEEQQARYNELTLTKNGKQKEDALDRLKADPMFKELMEHAGLDENGNYIFEDESFNYEDAVALQNDPNYKYCGTIGVGLSDAHIRKMLNDDNIKMVIPYHASGVSQLIKLARNLFLYTDYTNVQNTRGADGKKLEKGDGFNWYGKLKSEINPNGVEAKELAQMYLDYCDEKGYIPKFDQFRNEENYYKLLIDFRAYDNDGNFIPQGAVKMNMPQGKALEDIILPELQKQQAEEDRFSNEMKDAQGTLINDIKNNLRERGTLIDHEVRKSKEMEKSYDEVIESIDSYEIEDLIDEDELDEIWLSDLSIDDILGKLKNEYTEKEKKEIQKHLTRAALGEEFKNIDGKTVAITDERLDYYLNAFAATNKDYAQAYITYMSPADFLLLTANGNKGSETFERIKRESKEFDFEEFKAEKQPIFIDMDEKGINGATKNAIVGHEGRHRMYALQLAGYTKVPVLVFNLSNKYSKQHIDSITVEPQKYNGETKYNKSNKITLNDLEVLSSGNKETVRQKFGSGADADIRYSKEMDSAFEFMLDWEEANEYASILEDGAKEAQALDERVVKGIANKLRKEIGSKYDADLLAENLQKAFNYMATNEHVNYADMMRIFKEIATPVVEESSEMVGEEEYRDFVNDMKGYKISLTEAQMKGVESVFGSYEEFRNQMSPLNISDNGVALENIWNKMVEASGYILDMEATPSEMPTILYDTLQAMKPAPKSEYGGNVDDVAKDVAMRVVEEYLTAQNNVKAADKIRKRKADIEKKLKEEYRERYKKAKQTLIENKAKAVAEIRSEAKDKINANKEKNLERLALIKARYKGEAQQRNERAEVRHQKEQIEKSVKKLTKWIHFPSEQHHVPVEMVDPILNFVKALDFTTPSINKLNEKDGMWSMKVFDHSETDSNGKRHLIFTTIEGKSRNEVMLKYYEMLNEGRGSANARGWKERMQGIVDLYNQRNLDESSSNEVSQLLDASLAEELKEVMGNRTASVNNLTSSELKTINKALKNIINAVNNQNKMLTMNEEVISLSKSTMEYAENTKVNFAKSARKEKLWGTLFFNMATPDTFMHGLGEGAEKIYKSIRKGFNTFIDDVKTAQEFMKETMVGVKKSDIKKWNENVLHLDLPSGHTDITIAQIMSLYELNKRDQALTHYKGGVTVEEFSVGNKKYNKDAKKLHLTDADLEQLFSYLSPKHIEIADSLQKYMATVCADQGNEVSRKMYGFEKFTEERYFPITTNKDFIRANDSNTSVEGFSKIERSGFTKALVKDASNPIIVKNIFDVYTDHVSQMASYHGYAPALKDAMRWYNYKETDGEYVSVMEAIKKVYGNNGKSYFTKFIKDINQVDKSQYIGNFTDALISNYKASAVAGNLRVVAQQPTAYFRASNLINPIYLTEAMLPQNIARYSKWMGEDSEISQWKSWGYYETSVGRSMKEIVTGQNSLGDKIKNVAMAPAGIADDLTWRVLYTAVALEQKAKNKGLSENELREKIKERFDEVIDQTQVVDSTIHRSQYMRSKDTLNKLQTAFMAEPMKTYNMLFRAVMDDYRNGGLPKKTVRAFATFAVTSLATSAAAALIDGLRKTGDDDDYEEIYLESLQEGFIDNVNPLNLMPVIKDASGAIWNMISGESSFGNSSNRMDLDAISSLVDAINATYKYIEGDSNKTVYGLISTIVRPLSQMTGIPAYNLQRDLVSIYNQFGEDLAKTIEKPNDKYLSIYKSISKDDDIEVIKEKVNKAMEKEGTIKDVRSGINSRYKSDYYEALMVDEEEAKAIAELAKKGLMATDMTEEEANEVIKGWEADNYGYSSMDKAIASGEGIEEAMNHILQTKKKDNVVKHIIDRYADTFEYNERNTVDSELDERVEEALNAIGENWNTAKKAYDDLQEAKAEAKEAQEAKANAKENFYNVIQTGNGDYKSAIEDMVEAGTDYKTIKSNLSSDQTKPLIKAYYNGDKNAYKAIQRIVTVRAYLSQQMGTKIAERYHGDYLKYENDQVKKLMAEYEKNPW